MRNRPHVQTTQTPPPRHQVISSITTFWIDQLHTNTHDASSTDTICSFEGATTATATMSTPNRRHALSIHHIARNRSLEASRTLEDTNECMVARKPHTAAKRG